MDLGILFGILIFDIKGGFCMGYSLFKMANFENCLISRIFAIFLRIFFAKKNSK